MNLILFILASITVNTPDKINGLVEFQMPITITSSQCETLSIQLTLDTMETVKNMSIKDVSVWCDSIPVVKEREVYNIANLKATWQNWYLTPKEIVGKEDTIKCEKGYFWSKEYGLIKGTLNKDVLTDSHHFVGYDKYIGFRSDYVSVGKTSTSLDNIVIPTDMLSSDKTIATTVINKYKASVGVKADVKTVLSTNVISKGGINNIIIPKGTSKVRITFKKAKAEIGNISGNHGLVIKNKSGGILFNKVFNSWYSTYNYRQAIALNNDSLTANLTNFPYPCWWKVYATHTTGTKTIVDKDDATELWTNAEGDSVIWILKPTLTSATEDSVYYYINTTGTDKWNKDSSQCVFDTANGFSAVFHKKSTSDTMYDETYYNNDGIQIGGVVNEISKIDSGMYFNGSDTIICPTSTSLSLSDSLSIDCWVKFHSLPEYGVIIMKPYTINNWSSGGYGLMSTTNTVRFYVQQWNIYYAYATIDTGIMYHIVGSFNKNTASNNINISINNVLGTPSYYANSVGTSSISLHLGGAFIYPSIISLDEVRILKLVRSVNQTKNEYLFENNRTWQTWRAEESGLPVVTTDSANNIVDIIATVWGTLSDSGGANPVNCWFDYDTLKTFATQDSTTKGVVAMAAKFSANLSSLIASHKYYFRALASNSAGRDTGVIDSFTTLSHVPIKVRTKWLTLSKTRKWIDRCMPYYANNDSAIAHSEVVGTFYKTGVDSSELKIVK